MTQEASAVCADCGEPVELYEPNDPDSWIHACDANYWGDHTAWVESGNLPEAAEAVTR